MKAALAIATIALTGCGYRSVYAAPAGAMSVVKVHSLVPDALTATEVEQGLREALAREGALAAGSACPCVHVEVSRIDHAAGAIVARGEDPASASQIIAVVARATVDDGQGHTLYDSGDMRAESNYVLPTGTAVAEALRGQDAGRAAARRLGRMLGARLLGHASASEEAEGP